MFSRKFIAVIVLFLIIPLLSKGSDWDEFKVKRELDFTFVKEPTVKKEGDNVKISFETASNCDVTVVVEEKTTGNIIRHLACGVLGKNAPKPFKKNSKTQTIIWNMKDDKGTYIKEEKSVQIRVSLGLKPHYEKSLFNSPEQRFGDSAIRMVNTKAGVYVYDGGNSWDFVKLYDHGGKYIKTIYPISSSRMGKTKGIQSRKGPDGLGSFPVKINFLQNSFFKGGNNFGLKNGYPDKDNKHYGMYGKGISFFAVNDEKVVLGMSSIHTIGLKTLDVSFYGSIVSEEVALKRKTKKLSPMSAALSPDGSKLYLTAYHFSQRIKSGAGNYYNSNWDTLNMVKVVDLKTGKSNIFKGNNKLNKPGSDNNSFSIPIHVSTDSKGRVYVADFYNDRVQVYSQEGKFLKSIKAKRPTYVTVLNKSKNIVIATYGVEANKKKLQNKGLKPVVLSVMGPFEKPVLKYSVTLPKDFITSPAFQIYNGEGIKTTITVNDDAGEVRVWVCKEKAMYQKMAKKFGNNISLFRIKDRKAELIKAFEKVVKKKLIETKINVYGRNRIYVNPKSGNLFMPMSFSMVEGKIFKNILEINPDTEKIKQHKPHFDAEDMAFDLDGHIYLKTTNLLARFNLESWKEVPFDYGIQKKAHTSTSSARVVGEVVSGIKLPMNGAWHDGGFYVSSKGDIIISGGGNEKSEVKFNDAFQGYKGRNGYGRGYHLIHVFDKRGKPVGLDILRGLTDTYGVGIDQDRNCYVMSGATRVLDGESYSNKWSGTLMKLPLKAIKVLTDGKKIPIPLSHSSIPKQPADLTKWGQKFWVADAEWFFGGVGFAGKNAGTGCACFNFKMAFDYLNRTFVPELERYSVAVLDSSGNLICRIGQYGNADSQGAKSVEPLGGDEVGLVHGAYLATLTDKKLYIADQANSRIVSVSLGYHVNKIITLID